MKKLPDDFNADTYLNNKVLTLEQAMYLLEDYHKEVKKLKAIINNNKEGITHEFVLTGSTQGSVRTNVDIDVIEKHLRNSLLSSIVKENEDLTRQINYLTSMLKTRIVRNMIGEVDTTKIANNDSIVPNLLYNVLYKKVEKGLIPLSKEQIKEML